MPRHDKDKRVFMIEKYHEFKSSLKVIEAWKQEYPDDKPPTPMCILFQVKKFKTHGSIKNLPRPNAKINAKRDTAQNMLIDLMHSNHTISIRKAASFVIICI